MRSDLILIYFKIFIHCSALREIYTHVYYSIQNPQKHKQMNASHFYDFFKRSKIEKKIFKN